MRDQHALGAGRRSRHAPRSCSCGCARRARRRSAHGPCRHGRRIAGAAPWKRAAFSAKRGPKRSSSGSTLRFSASLHHSSIIAVEPLRLLRRRGRRSRRNRDRDGTAPICRSRTACRRDGTTTAFQPPCQRPRWPNISKYCGDDFDGAAASAIEAAKLSPSSGICGDAAIASGACNADHVEQGRHEVAGMHELMPQLAARRDPLRPGDHQRIADAAAMGVLLVAAQRRVRRHRPALRKVGVGVRPADIVDAARSSPRSARGGSCTAPSH